MAKNKKTEILKDLIYRSILEDEPVEIVSSDTEFGFDDASPSVERVIQSIRQLGRAIDMSVIEARPSDFPGLVTLVQASDENAPQLDAPPLTDFNLPEPPPEVEQISRAMQEAGEAVTRGLGSAVINASVDITRLAGAISESIQRVSARRQVFDFDPNPSGRECSNVVAINNSLYPYDPSADKYMMIPYRPVIEMERNSGYSARAIAGAYHHWWVRWYEENGPTIPWDLGIYVVELHTRQGFAPPWADKVLHDNLKLFQEEVNYPGLFNKSKTMPIQVLAKGYYNIFLALYYPKLALPGIKIEPAPPEKPLETPGPKERGKRSLSISDLIVNTQYRSARK